MEKYKLKDFAKWAFKEGLRDGSLNDAIDEMNRGLRGDQLGASIFKKRIGTPGRGKRGGVRTIVLFQQQELIVFLYGYSKSEKADLDPREEAALRVFSKAFMKLSKSERAQRVIEGVLIAID